MIRRAWSKSASEPIASATEAVGASSEPTTKSVQLTGINPRDSSGKISRRCNRPARCLRLMTLRRWPSNG
ncbi:hypothetical protein OU5_P0108 (plasmid) [Pseudomonas mandelii JR-1]|uniref:Uncharacterized protein n=1 Tax=Pseudomonas mandelii JR-1 TaxID=1147786 RepID=A0A024EL77_9PSED|nr:hypothetical protein OU5_P0078 [Pseudomonas mandelii JR-1]AHZ73360.1 hypothetical protein OU5_P0108 [Pseudomonas mandelii JR-1]